MLVIDSDGAWSCLGTDAKFSTTKISSEGLDDNSAKFCTSENFPLYGMCYTDFTRTKHAYLYFVKIIGHCSEKLHNIKFLLYLLLIIAGAVAAI